MPIFHYTAVNAASEVLEGDIEAADNRGVIEHLRAQGLLPVRTEERTTSSPSPDRSFGLGRNQWRRREPITLALRELSILLRAGLAVDHALDVIATYTDRPMLKRLVSNVADRVRGGASLADAMAKEDGAFDGFCIGMVRAGEAGGTLDQVLSRVADFQERSRRFRREVQAALRYPLILLVFSLISVAMIITVVIPGFEEIFVDAGFPLPLATRVVMAVGRAAESYGWLLPLLALTTVLVALRLLRRPETRMVWDRFLLRLPVLGGVLARAETVRLCYTLGMLLTNGVPLVAAMPLVCQTLSNRAMITALNDVERQVKAGRPFAERLAVTGLFPPMGMHLLRVGEEGGRLDEMLLRVADTYEQDVQRDIQSFLTFLVPILTCIMALLIGGIIASILLPMLSIPELAL